MTKIIVSYRRSDSAAIAGRIFDRLADHYGDERVFMDIDKIPFGTDFRKHIKGVLEGGGILLAVVGPNWLGKTADGNRMTDEADPVRVEIESALRQGMTVLPVLVDGATMPGAAELPESMRDFAFINAAPLDVGRDFRTHMERVISAMDGILRGAPPKPPSKAEAQIERGYPSQPRRMLWSAIAGAAALIAAGAIWAAAPWRDGSVTMDVSRSSDGASAARVEASRAAPKNTAAAPTTSDTLARLDIGSNATPVPNQAAPNQASKQPNVSDQFGTPNQVAPPSKLDATGLKPVAPIATYRVLPNVSGGVQNLRGGPAVRYPLVVAIPAGATGLALGACRASEDGTRPWCAATWRTYSGWISSCCIVDEKSSAPPRID